MAPKPQRRSIRFAIVAVVCLLLGAATAMGVAASVSLFHIGTWEAVDGAEQSEIGSFNETNLVSVITLTRSESNSANWNGRPIPSYLRRSASFVDGPACMRTGWAFGWPCRCLGGSVEWPVEGPVSLDGFIDLSSRDNSQLNVRGPEFARERLLPSRVYWPGFALDTAAYAAAWYVVMFTPLPLMRAGRRRFRVSRGMCGHCGYDLKGSTRVVCPECGRPS